MHHGLEDEIMFLTYYEYRVLRILIADQATTQRKISESLEISLGTVNKVIKALRSKNIITADAMLTDYGQSVLDTYKVDNAIIMAAGMSSRFAPLSYENPKGLLRVRGEILIERQIEQLQEAGITDITLVLGYMKEKFFYLEDKYGVSIRINADYQRFNNTSTLMCVLDKLANTYICSSDNYFVENVFDSHEYRAYYPVVTHDIASPGEYYVTYDAQQRITNVTIGEGVYCMLGHVYYDRKFSQEFKKLLVNEYEKVDVRKNLWERLYLDNIDRFNMYVRFYSDGVIQEFDALSELQDFDKDYLINTDSKILQFIMKTLDCSISEIRDIKALNSELSWLSFQFNVKGVQYLFRKPIEIRGIDIDKQFNASVYNLASLNELDRTYVYIDPDQGYTLSRVITNTMPLQSASKADIVRVLEKISLLRTFALENSEYIDIWGNIESLVSSLSDVYDMEFEGFSELYSGIKRLYDFTEQDAVQRGLSHFNLIPDNIVLTKDIVSFSNWHEAGIADPSFDIGSLLSCFDLNYSEALEILKSQDFDTKTLRHHIAYIAIASFYWFVWSLYQEKLGGVVRTDTYRWYRNADYFKARSMELYKI